MSFRIAADTATFVREMNTERLAPIETKAIYQSYGAAVRNGSLKPHKTRLRYDPGTGTYGCPTCRELLFFT